MRGDKAIMETQTNLTRLQALTRKLDRREHSRVCSNIRCVVKTRGGMSEYGVADLSISGALLTGGPRLRDRSPLIVLLRVPLYPEVRIPARVIRAAVDEDGSPAIGIEFVHSNDVTEDHIQSALLSELERSRSDGRIADVLQA